MTKKKNVPPARISCDLPLDLWNRLQEEGKKVHLAPTQMLRVILSEHFDALDRQREVSPTVT